MQIECGPAPEMISSLVSPTRMFPKLIALHLPQFHAIPENDEWWGKGFTEWTNVSRAKPSFRRHYQPHLPADLGYYDLRLPEVREAQASLAAEYGIDGFCYYHYWFNGRRLLERPHAEILKSGEPKFPYCLCWANESWSRRWLGEERNLLMEQKHSLEDDKQHALYLLKSFEDDRYIRVGDRPVFAIYRPDLMPDPSAAVEVYKDTCRKHGVPEPWMIGVDAHRPGSDYTKLGFDATLGFEPQLGVFAPECFRDGASLAKLRNNLSLGIYSSRLKVYDEREARRRMAGIRRVHPYHPCCFVAWDNTARRGKEGIVYVNGSPELFQESLVSSMERAEALPEEARIVFVNAWNEWAEGNHLEPDQRNGHAYLEAVRRARRIYEQSRTKSDAEHRLPPAAVPSHS